MPLSSRRQIEKLIEKSEDEIISWQVAIDFKKSYIQGLRDTLKYLPKDTDDSAQAQLRPGTDLAKAYEALRLEGKPLHVLELLKRIGKEPTNKNRVSLSGSIGLYVRRKQFFARPAPNTFAAIADGSERNDAPSDEPPDDFGIEEEKAET
jgi:hypothetical protein